MKRKFTTLLLALSVAMVATAQNDTSCSASKPTPDAKLISKSQEGDFMVCRYLVQDHNSTNDEFSVRYKINLSKLISTYDRNAEELKGLNNFVSEITRDTLKKVKSVMVTGYASPDGPAALNERLSMARAADFKEYINTNYQMGKYPNTVEAVALPWSAASGLIEESSVPQKSAVLELVNSDQSATAVESKLRKMTSSWDYMKVNILPPMRCVELVVKYNSWRVVETRERVNQQGEPVAVTDSSYIVVLLDDNMGGELIEMPNSALDFPCDKEEMKFKNNRRETKFKERSIWGKERGKFKKRRR